MSFHLYYMKNKCYLKLHTNTTHIHIFLTNSLYNHNDLFSSQKHANTTTGTNRQITSSTTTSISITINNPQIINQYLKSTNLTKLKTLTTHQHFPPSSSIIHQHHRRPPRNAYLTPT